MNPVVKKIEEEGKIPLPDLLNQLEMDKSKVLEVVHNHSSLNTEFVYDEKIDLAYHVVEVA